MNEIQLFMSAMGTRGRDLEICACGIGMGITNSSVLGELFVVTRLRAVKTLIRWVARCEQNRT